MIFEDKELNEDAVIRKFRITDRLNRWLKITFRQGCKIARTNW
jgi:hypothetical protein